jgi:hypothetical protein
MTSQFVKDLWMLQWTLNVFLEAGSNEVRRSDIQIWVDASSDSIFNALKDWESKGFIAVLVDPRRCKEKEVCLRILKKIQAVSEPEHLDDDA